MNRKTAAALKNKQRTFADDSFLEALRDLGSGVVDSVAHDVVGGVAEEAIDQLTGKKINSRPQNQTLQPGEWSEVEQNAWEKENVEPLQREFNQVQQQEKVLFKQSEQDTQLQIRGILEELKKLAAATETLAEEVEIAVDQAPVDPGIYHLSFFEKLRQTILLFEKQIENSSTWLAAFNQKAKKHNYYWGQVRKSGSKYLLSQDRYVSTQAG
ncbi:hypothetical protein COT64_02970 [Candidatus Shapirobacteria bacterium CG09_land_8_20_14_0_10_39_12]|uniref:DUF5660 domain-containing protein n=1 Tax=Candidatus Shapirobacteria bacterium CG09_land_8_20_14_0_10_39_12 TaxID=1974885 RepID=A0A2H0WP01_9BACT|nr:MAG: hypothetical protein COT64_02970 [Candidatus Shapirobacteria bacterium CG09_land_8_20_14_0_10_39_12]